ncbi:uncharacterized protein LOC106739543 isoform X2 [Alligator mississippiensis]|uniref:uncharacterized protein LOC106739543 isoform X2 n=1 Tax=Alligator mississippiensis TaxID=8496 RepID=UPI00090757F1|nr:uncharacterized protein LOC106739543 isoform X2 [Alligator mississippiensis]
MMSSPSCGLYQLIGGAEAATLPGSQHIRKLPGSATMCGAFIFLLALRLAGASPGVPTVQLLDHEGPVLEGDNVTLECMAGPGADMSSFSFQKYSPWLQSWVQLDAGARLRCWFYAVAVSRPGGRLLLDIARLQRWHEGAYRCAPMPLNDTFVPEPGPSNASGEATFMLHVDYLRDVWVTWPDAWCGTVGDTVTVTEGEDLELECAAEASRPPKFDWTRDGEAWTLQAQALGLRGLQQDQAGTYRCHARLSGLTQSRAVTVLVEPPAGTQRLETAQTPGALALVLAVVLPVVLLVVLATVLAAWVQCRHPAKSPPPEVSGQRIPIFKGSLESVQGGAGDTHPLVR